MQILHVFCFLLIFKYFCLHVANYDIYLQTRELCTNTMHIRIAYSTLLNSFVGRQAARKSQTYIYILNTYNYEQE